MTGCWPLVRETKAYPESLAELSAYRFCFCIRGNGLDTHRFWESLYLGVIPVVLQTPETASDLFLAHIAALGVPFVSLRTDAFEAYPESYFDQTLYDDVVARHPDYRRMLRLEAYATPTEL